jgi:hypothetical protein
MSLPQALHPSLADVFITGELDRRAPTKTDYLQEKLALQDLAARMVDQPEDILPRFVDLAMEMAGGVSAGLSLYETNPAPGVFRWQYLPGILAPFNGATTPRNFSPCGVTLDRNAPVLSTHPEQREEKLVLRWVERGGPSIEAPPVSSGFGSKLTESAFVRQFGGTLDDEW